MTFEDAFSSVVLVQVGADWFTGRAACCCCQAHPDLQGWSLLL